jgi:hypothetical protein
MVPVDYVSKAIVHLSRQKAQLGKVFHFIPQNPTSFNEIFGLLRSRGYRLAHQRLADWKQNLVNSTDNALTSFVPIIMEMSDDTDTGYIFSVDYDHKNTIAGLKGSSIVCPELDDSLLMKYIQYYIDCGFLAVSPTQLPTKENGPVIQ